MSKTSESSGMPDYRKEDPEIGETRSFTIRVPAVLEKRTSACLLGNMHARDSLATLWFPETQKSQPAGFFHVFILEPGVSFARVLRSFFGRERREKEMSKALIARKFTTGFPVIEGLADMHAHGLDSLKGGGVPNYFFLEDSDGLVTVDIVKYRDEKWIHNLVRLGTDPRHLTEGFVYFFNPDPA